MQISPISSSSSTPQVLNPVLSSRVKTTSSAASSTSADASATTASTSAAPVTSAAPAKTSQAHSSGGGSASGSAVAEMQATSYSTTVAGVQYSGSVQESGGEYTASIANLSGATATGSSEQAAEDNLNAKIDEIV